MRPSRWLLALILALAVVCVPTAAVMAAPASLPAAARGCTTTAAQGKCGPYDSYPDITGTTSSTYVGNNVWNPIPGWHQTLTAINPGDWHVTANMPAGNTAVVSYPSIGANYGKITNVPTPLTSYSVIRSRFAENMNATPRTSAWAAYDIWLGKDGCSSCSADEVMIQHDFANNRPRCGSYLATVAFWGQRWGLCTYGSEIIWQLPKNERTGVVHILTMLKWLVHHGYLPAHTGLWIIGYGWEICSTGGQPETFRISSYKLRTVCKTHICR